MQYVEQALVVLRPETSYAAMLTNQPGVYGADDKQHEQISIDDDLIHRHRINSEHQARDVSWT